LTDEKTCRENGVKNQYDNVTAVVEDYVDKVVPKIYGSWLKIGAHTIAYGYPEQSLFWHSVNASMIACKLVEYFENQDQRDLVNLRELIATVTLHDLDRISQDKFGHKITLQEVEDAFVKFGIGDFCKTLTPEMVQTLMETLLKSARSSLA
jgi:hypothetical protein